MTRASAVALRKESVDRNALHPDNRRGLLRSLSARRAWIEIDCCFPADVVPVVALRKESVDRNKLCHAQRGTLPESLSARRAWIEIAKLPAQCGWEVSLSARRAWIEIFLNRCAARPTKVALRKESRECFSF